MSSDLPVTSYAVLGLLSFDRELTGYELKKWADSSLRFFYWSPATSQIYGELKRLDGLGLVEARPILDDARAKRAYRITDAGRAALREWVAHAPVEAPVLKHSTVLRIWLGHLAEPARLRAVLSEHRTLTEQLLEDARKAEVGARNDAAWAFPELVNRWAARHYEAELELTDALLADLDALFP